MVPMCQLHDKPHLDTGLLTILAEANKDWQNDGARDAFWSDAFWSGNLAHEYKV